MAMISPRFFIAVPVSTMEQANMSYVHRWHLTICLLQKFEKDETTLLSCFYFIFPTVRRMMIEAWRCQDDENAITIL